MWTTYWFVWTSYIFFSLWKRNFVFFFFVWKVNCRRYSFFESYDCSNFIIVSKAIYPRLHCNITYFLKMTRKSAKPTIGRQMTIRRLITELSCHISETKIKSILDRFNTYFERLYEYYQLILIFYIMWNLFQDIIKKNFRIVSRIMYENIIMVRPEIIWHRFDIDPSLFIKYFRWFLSNGTNFFKAKKKKITRTI